MLKRSANQILLSFLLDVVCVFASIALSSWMRLFLPVGIPLIVLPWVGFVVCAALCVYPIVFISISLYAPERNFQGFDEYQLLLAANLLAGLALSGLIYYTERGVSRLFLVYVWMTNLILTFTWRFVQQWIANRRHKIKGITTKVLIVGGGKNVESVIEKLKMLSNESFDIVGYLTDDTSAVINNDQVPFLGALHLVSQIVQSHQVDEVLIALPAENHKEVQELVTCLFDKPCNIWMVPDVVNLLIYGSEVRSLRGIPMISIKVPTLTGYQRVVKRSFDIVIGSIWLLLALPLMALIALAVKLDSRGTVIFRQKRVGENGRLFEMYKFRTMVANAEELLSNISCSNEQGQLIHKLPNDPRVTRVGKILRRSSLDELPQLFNILKGEMSLVGPRPELPALVAKYESWQQKRFAVPQGLTGWWQVNGRSDRPMHLNTDYDLYYIQNYSLLLDIQILFRSIGVVINGRGAF